MARQNFEAPWACSEVLGHFAQAVDRATACHAIDSAIFHHALEAALTFADLALRVLSDPSNPSRVELEKQGQQQLLVLVRCTLTSLVTTSGVGSLLLDVCPQSQQSLPHLLTMWSMLYLCLSGRGSQVFVATIWPLAHHLQQIPCLQ